MSEQAIIEIKDISVLFPVQGSRSPVRAVDGVSFDVLHRETFGIIGESGAGKSTVGRVLVCLQEPSGGTLKIGRAHVRNPVAKAQLVCRRLLDENRTNTEEHKLEFLILQRHSYEFF